MSETKDPNIAALLRELEGYVLYGKADRAEQVRADLKRRGYVEPAKKAAPVERSPRKQATAEAPAKSEG